MITSHSTGIDDMTLRAAELRTPPAPSDALLIEQICQRQEPALGALYDRYSRLIYTVALRVTGDQSVAEEVVQAVFSTVWQSASSFRVDGNVAAWLTGITRHRAIEAMRVRNFREHSNAQTLDELLCVSTANQTEAHSIASLEREQIQRALTELPPIQRRAIELAYYAGLPCAEIAARTDVPLGTVKTRLRLGLAKLRVLLIQ